MEVFDAVSLFFRFRKYFSETGGQSTRHAAGQAGPLKGIVSKYFTAILEPIRRRSSRTSGARNTHKKEGEQETERRTNRLTRREATDTLLNVKLDRS